MSRTAWEIENAFNACFRVSHCTVLRGGADEPVYAPSRDPIRAPHVIRYREDYVQSALHEVAHWCLAGRSRRLRPDYGYWYAPDGRTPAQQAAFERVEVKPQALEWVFAEAAGVTFSLSADNLEGNSTPSHQFASAVSAQRARYLCDGLPQRAKVFMARLRPPGSPGR
ncbi:MAG: elongation factor P hydroxylase [Myxococcota bacterium]